MSEPSIHDQWKANGDCAMCRRKSYCHTPCTAAKKRARRIGQALGRKIRRGEVVMKAEVPDGQKV